MAYEFKYTKQNGYRQVYLSKKDHNELFPNRKITWVESYVYFLKDDECFILCNVSSLVAKILNILFYPVALLAHGVVNYKELNNEIYREWNSLKTGSFVEDRVMNSVRDKEFFDKITSKLKVKS